MKAEQNAQQLKESDFDNKILSISQIKKNSSKKKIGAFYPA